MSESSPDSRFSYNIGDQVADRYILQELLGKGTFGYVYRAYDNQSKNDVALKIELPTRSSYGAIDILYPLRKESCIVKLLFVDQRDGFLFTAYPLCKRQPKTLPIQEKKFRKLIPVFLRMLQVLENHRVVHYDVKPDNIVWDDEGKPVLCDFGLSQRLEFSHYNPGDWSGQTYTYRSPECWMKEPVSHASDVWSMGATLYYYLTGKDLVQPIYKALEKASRDYEYSSNAMKSERIIRLMDISIPMIETLRVSQDIKWLLQTMTSLNPEDRLSGNKLAAWWNKNYSIIYQPVLLPYPYPSAYELNTYNREAFVSWFEEEMPDYITELEAQLLIIRSLQFLDRLHPDKIEKYGSKIARWVLFLFKNMDEDIVPKDLLPLAQDILHNTEFRGVFYSSTLYDAFKVENIDTEKYFEITMSGEITNLTWDQAIEVCILKQ